MKLTKILILALGALLLLNACAGSKGVSKSNAVPQPDWWRIQDSDEFLYTFGMGEKVSENSSFDAARSNAMLEATQYVETKVQGMVKNFEEEIGVVNPELHALTSKVVKEVANAKFSGTFVSMQQPYLIDTENGKRYKTYVRVSIPMDTINKNVVNQIRSEEALYNEFKASQAFQELENSVNN